ncbi:hypothetical protein Pcinc_013187 [Petrolisthes cinctipes]|uniref:Carboxylesterase type B domain-containing protein n=1 Tax=Petrolisthes cinctipes TaxID=88211 RepID=A0AAE1FXW6_PETCI|nr:hypothetical protein Pcinc_013187 [Petrolisthes cinctipes]
MSLPDKGPTGLGTKMRLLAVLSVCVVVLGTAAGNEEGLVVDTDKGRVEGIVEETLKGRPFFSFLGIPYARPPTGTLRFKIKAKHRDERLPVMVFIHGGGFLFGSAEEYLPHVLLDHQIVLVVMQYRLGVMAIFARSDMQSALENQFSSAAPVSLGVSEDEDPATLAKKIYEYYLGDVNIDADHADQLNQMFTDVHFGLSHDLVTQYHARVVHADDLLYLFVPGALFQTTFETNQLETPQDIAMKDLMTKMWVNFAATGHPTPDDSLGFTWDPSTADHLTFLEITPKPTMRPDSNQKMREFHASLNTKMYQHLFHTDSGQTRPDDEL